ncbi:MAG: hypothetical protein PHS57_06990 [Alphaproteobacteria bacterium]|nr:hypothetical protein [Alphaproteobacteria bacterium]
MPESVPSEQPLSLSADFSSNFEALLRAVDQEFRRIPSKKLERFRFSLNGFVFDVRGVQQDASFQFMVTTILGYLPFSIESPKRREAIKTIIVASRRLPSVRFGVDSCGRISACALLTVSHVEAPDVLFYPLMLFLQEARPFIRLIGQYLVAPRPEAGGAALSEGSLSSSSSVES